MLTSKEMHMLYSELGFERASLIFSDPTNFPLQARVNGVEVSLTYNDFSRLVVQGVDFEIDEGTLQRILAKYGEGV
jgi:hypothetical protein